MSGPDTEILAEAGFRGPRRVVVEAPGILSRTVCELVADVYSRSNSAPHLFGARLPEFDARLRALLTRGGGYQVPRPATEVRIWTNP